MPFPLADSVAASLAAESSAAGTKNGHPEGESAPPRARASAPGRDASPLPCLSSNNSDKEASKLSPYQRKNAYSINENLAFVVQKFGLGKIGFLTLTFPKNLTLKEANRRFNSLSRRFLDSHFVCWMCVREFTKGGRPHFHLIVVCREEIRDGFGFENYVKMARLSRTPESRRKHSKEIGALSRALNPSPELRSLWGALRSTLPLYQFGRHELIPIRKNGAALARYVGGYVRKSMDFRPVEVKGAHLISYSKTFPRKVVGHAWAFNTEGSSLWRAKVELFAKLHKIRDLDHMKDRFGPRWAWWFKDVISSLNLLPVLPIDRVRAYIEGMDMERIEDAVEAGRLRMGMHLYRPQLPKIEGRFIPPPARLRSVFEFHLANWGKTPDQLATAEHDERQRLRHLRTRSNFTHDALASARAALLAVPAAPVLSVAEIRSRNFMRIRHPALYAATYGHLTESS